MDAEHIIIARDNKPNRRRIPYYVLIYKTNLICRLGGCVSFLCCSHADRVSLDRRWKSRAINNEALMMAHLPEPTSSGQLEIT